MLRPFRDGRLGRGPSALPLRCRPDPRSRRAYVDRVAGAPVKTATRGDRGPEGVAGGPDRIIEFVPVGVPDQWCSWTGTGPWRPDRRRRDGQSPRRHERSRSSCRRQSAMRLVGAVSGGARASRGAARRRGSGEVQRPAAGGGRRGCRQLASRRRGGRSDRGDGAPASAAVVRWRRSGRPRQVRRVRRRSRSARRFRRSGRRRSVRRLRRTGGPGGPAGPAAPVAPGGPIIGTPELGQADVFGPQIAVAVVSM